MSTTRPFKQKLLQAWRLIKIGAMIIVPILLLCLPADYFDHGKPSVSVFEWIGVEGHYSQGLTRASMHLIHLDFDGAASYNRLAFVVVPMLIIVFIAGLIREIRRYRRVYLSPPKSAA